MTNFSNSAGSRPTDDAKPDWSWLQERVDQTPTEQLADWLQENLVALEDEFAELMTSNSRNRAAQADFVADRSRAS